MIRVICDRCGAVIPASGKVGYLAWNFKHGADGDLTGDNLLENQQYCQNCMCKILAFISGSTGEEIAASGGAASSGQNAGGEDVEAVSVKGSPASDPSMEESGDTSTAMGTDGAQDGEKGKGKRKRIDIGKVMALRNAKWSIEKIADEMGVAPNSITNAISRYRRKQDEGNTEISGQ